MTVQFLQGAIHGLVAGRAAAGLQGITQFLPGQREGFLNGQAGDLANQGQRCVHKNLHLHLFHGHARKKGYHGERVLVGYDYHQADRVWVREFDGDSGQPGRLICVARFGANAERYYPKSFEQDAIETRAKGRLRRVEDKRDGLLRIEQRADRVADFIDVMPVVPEAMPVAMAEPEARMPAAGEPGPRKRRSFASDEELAAWVLEHPEDLTPQRTEVLRGCLRDSTARKLFELSGIDLEALRNLLRAAA